MLVAVAQGVAQTGLDRAPRAELQGERQHDSAGGSGDLRRAVGAAIVDDHHRTPPKRANLGDDGADRGGFVVGRDQDDEAIRGNHRVHTIPTGTAMTVRCNGNSCGAMQITAPGPMLTPSFSSAVMPCSASREGEADFLHSTG